MNVRTRNCKEIFLNSQISCACGIIVSDLRSISHCIIILLVIAAMTSIVLWKVDVRLFESQNSFTSIKTS